MRQELGGVFAGLPIEGEFSSTQASLLWAAENSKRCAFLFPRLAAIGLSAGEGRVRPAAVRVSACVLDRAGQ